ncbi:hypothetical protein [Rhizobium leguminosarum]|jgi:hypothetical protein|uniref:Uncharacterized protein n=1 Tax=Rhizobium leguminosarum bv. trifolii (strain WSM1325) TaxID=395491 RepID=C6AY73_RHILS|nr:hypothetical protein [Rhizobium leguminosarum]ACS58222.1 conserved hypothetical protein [Rhizobium leguminosarum bv. trifolii WSM1325]MBY2907486.1 hypothetical protein [Rhizobium leguminosarum]MBY2916391.1 hypothetical protein [Rhizobium leguminosarum]MBY2935211.1 hypothetical protein [Rhizobium leguminosarum]MBY2947491.1 hypothetical protein [Rhizobium leguminosarum]
MFRSLSAVALLALSVLAALPAEAGDRRNDHRFPGHRHAFHGGLLLGERAIWRDRGIRFDNAYRYRNRKERMPFLKQFSSPATNRIARNNLIVVLPQTQGGDGGGTYAGSSYVYQVDGGTYVGGNGYGYPTARPELLAPKAKVIDIAVRDDPCSYEANVCVIRP